MKRKHTRKTYKVNEKETYKETYVFNVNDRKNPLVDEKETYKENVAPVDVMFVGESP